ncbi:MAG: metallophosphoesterase [Clostridia bacterium]|nr:metallophosphoesterase [Clostridia bacterium]
MGKMKKILLAALTLGCTLSFAFACGGGNNGDQGGNSSSQEQSSSVPDSEESSLDISSEISSEIVSESEESSLEESDESSESVHTCITEGDWITNSTGHWLKCDCNKLVQYGSHSGEATVCAEQAICTVCKIPFGNPKDHSYGELSDGEHGMAYYCDCGEYLTNEDLVDFVLPIESGKDPVVLHISDTQIMDYGDVETLCYRYVRDAVQRTNPDLIILTGDIVYGKFDPYGTILKGLINFMETLDTPWAPVFGNHDNESLMGVDWQCAQLEAAENCLFKQGDLTGNGNYSVGLEQDGELLRVFYMMDSNGCTKPMCDSNGVQTTPALGTNEVRTSEGFAADQVMWYTDQINAIHAVDADVKISFAYHIQQVVFTKAFQKYEEYNGVVKDGSYSELRDPLNLDTLETADETDFGYLACNIKGGWDGGNNPIFKKMKELGVDSIFVGHEHCNSASIVYDGVRFQYGQKTSQYDRYNVLTSNREIKNVQEEGVTGTPLMGGTVIPVSGEDGSIGTGYIVYFGDPFDAEGESGSTGGDSTENGGSSETPTQPAIVVDGLQYGTDITAQSDNGSSFGSMEAVAYDENTNAYYIVSGTSYNRIYINVNLLKGKTTVSFDILVPEEATSTEGNATQEFAIRVKPNQTEDALPGVDGGYLWFDASYSGERKITIGEWQTIVIDISAFADVCTEFGIYFVAGNNSAYVKNIAVS